MLTYIAIGLVSFVYTGLLTEPGMIFSKAYEHAQKLPNWLFMPLIGCHRCNAGQLALWHYIFEHNVYRLDLHVLYICISILTAEILIILWDYSKN